MTNTFGTPFALRLPAPTLEPDENLLHALARISAAASARAAAPVAGPPVRSPWGMAGTPVRLAVAGAGATVIALSTTWLAGALPGVPSPLTHHVPSAPAPGPGPGGQHGPASPTGTGAPQTGSHQDRPGAGTASPASSRPHPRHSPARASPANRQASRRVGRQIRVARGTTPARPRTRTTATTPARARTRTTATTPARPPIPTTATTPARTALRTQAHRARQASRPARAQLLTGAAVVADDQLIAAAKEGDPDAWRELYRAHAGPAPGLAGQSVPGATARSRPRTSRPRPG